MVTKNPHSLRSGDTYLDYSDRPDRVNAGITLVPIDTPKGKFRVWTKRVGNNPDARVLLLHGGPGGTHEYLEIFDSYLPAAGIEYHYYCQLGSRFSDQPDDPELWTIDRFVDEVEQVRVALGLDRSNFYLFGQSWGGILAIEYALRYQEHLKGMIISNMMASMVAYNEYAKTKIMPAMDQAVLAQIKAFEEAGEFNDPRYQSLLLEHHYIHKVLRMPVDEWPDSVNRAFSNLNPSIYIPMQGPSELGASGILADWDRSTDIRSISVPTLVIGGQHDTMDPAHLQWMADEFPQGQGHLCPEGSHMAMYDDQESYFEALLGFIATVERNSQIE
jgi:proline iminopeptidase